MVCITPRGSLRGAVATKQSQSEIATPFGLAMTTFCDSNCRLLHALVNNRWGGIDFYKNKGNKSGTICLYRRM
jgi:hypothetical protein